MSYVDLDELRRNEAAVFEAMSDICQEQGKDMIIVMLNDTVHKRFQQLINELEPIGGKYYSRQELEDWLYSICLNNVGTDFCKDVEEIISRLDGFEQYIADKRGEG